MNYRDDLSYEIVSSILEYDQKTGILKWKYRKDVKKWWNEKYSGTIAGCLHTGYIRIKINGIRYQAHRLAWLLANKNYPSNYLDHINMDRSDNRLCNLRIATTADNQANVGVKSNNKSGYKGVGFHKSSKKFRARITKNKVRYDLGSFSTAEMAHEAYRKAAIKYHGQYANVGEPHIGAGDANGAPSLPKASPTL